MDHEPTPNHYDHAPQPGRDREADDFFAQLHAREETEHEELRSELETHLKRSFMETLPVEGDVNSRQARLAAFLLPAFTDAGAPALEHFARTGSGDAAQLRAEYGRIRTGSGHSDAELFGDLLGTHLFHRDHPETTPPEPDTELHPALIYLSDADDEVVRAVPLQTGKPTTGENVLALMSTIGPLLERYGDPFRAWLRLPGTDARTAYLEEEYLKHFGGGIHPHEVDVLKIHGPDGPIDYSTIEVGGVVYAFIR